MNKPRLKAEKRPLTPREIDAMLDPEGIHLFLGPNLVKALEAVAPGESCVEQLCTLFKELRDVRDACLRLLQAAEGMDSLNDDESRAEAYAEELEELSKAKDQARAALNLLAASNAVERSAP